MDFNRLKEALKNEPAYRLKQAEELVFKQLIEDWSDAQGLPAGLREKLKKDVSLAIEAEVVSSESKDADKAIIFLSDGIRIETVLMRHKGGPPEASLAKDGPLAGEPRHHGGRNTVCVSSQAGCPMGCVFCATGKGGFKRNLTVSEIILQLLFFARRLKITNERVDNVVFMGMGEPFLNYDAVMEAVKLINSKNGFNIGARHISISTVGVVEGIEKLSEELIQVNLAISLHAPNDALRSRIVPANNKYPIGNIMWAVYEYVKKTNRRVMFEYIMIDGVNDSDDNARELAALIKKRLSLKLAFVNLITYNPTGDFKPSSRDRVREFKEIIDRENVETTERHRFGREIKAACGQLANRSLSNNKQR